MPRHRPDPRGLGAPGLKSSVVDRTSVDVRAYDRRRIRVEVAGPEDGDVVIYHTGTPSSGSLYEGLIEAGAERGLRHVSYARPGYPGSERKPGRDIADCIDDVLAIMDELGIDRAYTVGHSGGGPHALACAAALPHRLYAAATSACVAPFWFEGPEGPEWMGERPEDWMAGMAEENLREFAAKQTGPAELEEYLKNAAEHLGSVTGDEVVAALGDLVSEADRAVLHGDYAGHVAGSLRESVRDGVWGWFDDDQAFFEDWGFNIDSMGVPVTIWQGEEDRMVPFAHGQWLASHVSGRRRHATTNDAKPMLLAGEGHLSIEIGSYGAVLDDLVASRA